MAAARSNSILVVSLVFATSVGVAPLQSGWLTMEPASRCCSSRDAASAAYEQVLQLDPSDSAASYMLAYVSFYGRHDIETRQARLQQLVAAPLQPQQTYNVYVLSGRLALAQGNSDAALAWFQRAVELPFIAPRFALNEIASMYEGLGKYDQATTALRDAARDAPTDHAFQAAGPTGI